MKATVRPWQQKLRLTLSDIEEKPRAPFQADFKMEMGADEICRL
jgi:hypothetical protein